MYTCTTHANITGLVSDFTVFDLLSIMYTDKISNGIELQEKKRINAETRKKTNQNWKYDHTEGKKQIDTNMSDHEISTRDKKSAVDEEENCRQVSKSHKRE